MKIRKMKDQIVVDGVRIYINEIILFTDVITIISADDLAAEEIKLTAKRIFLITENSEEIPIG